jgi:S1-C subfamily serine protease
MFLLAMILSFQSSTPAADTKITPAGLKRAKAATVHIKVRFADGDTSEGSGFVALAKGLIITNAHVVGMLDNDSRKPEKIEVTFNSGEPNSKTVAAKVGYVDGDSDLALLAYPTLELKELPELLPIFLSQKLLETQDVFVVGFPLGKKAGNNVTVTATSVTSLRKEGANIKHVQVNGGMHPGNSGGPVVDKDGNLVGIAVASFAGTQLHLAIPTEVLNAVTNGRIVNSTYAVPYREGDKIKVPFRFEKADPLNKMKSIAVETWTGKPGPVRPSSSEKKPEPLPDDSPVSVVEVTQDFTGAYTGELVLDGNKDPRLAYWSRYQVGRPGERTTWYPAAMMGTRVGTPVDRKPAEMKYAPPLGKAGVLAMVSDASFRIREADGEDHTIAMNLKGTLVERVTDHAKDGKWRKRLTYDGIETNATVDKKPIEGAERLMKALKDVSLLASEVEVDRDGSISRNLADYSKVPAASRSALTLVGDQVQQSLDSLAVPLPAKEVAPLTTWRGRQNYMLGAMGLEVPAKGDITYAYEGIYVRDGKNVAVISFTGPLEADFSVKTKKGVKPPMLSGKVEGKVELMADTGLTQFAAEKVKAEVSMEYEGKPSKAIVVLNVQVRRNPPAAKKK